MKSITKYLLIASMVIWIAGCKKETQPAEENDNELITTIQLDFTKRGTDDKSTFLWEDVDGPGGALPVIDEIMLDDNHVYDVVVKFWNKSVTPADDITKEVQAESANHRLYYEPTAGSGIVVDGLDNDTEGLPLGLNSVWTTGNSASGSVTIILRHYPEGGKAAEDPANSTKSTTDAGASFTVTVGQ